MDPLGKAADYRITPLSPATDENTATAPSHSVRSIRKHRVCLHPDPGEDHPPS